MSVSYRVYLGYDTATVMLVNGFEMDFTKSRGRFEVAREIAEDKVTLERVIEEHAVRVMGMHPNAVHVWECKDLGDKK